MRELRHEGSGIPTATDACRRAIVGSAVLRPPPRMIWAIRRPRVASFSLTCPSTQVYMPFCRLPTRTRNHTAARLSRPASRGAARRPQLGRERGGDGRGLGAPPRAGRLLATVAWRHDAADRPPCKPEQPMPRPLPHAHRDEAPRQLRCARAQIASPAAPGKTYRRDRP